MSGKELVQESIDEVKRQISDMCHQISNLASSISTIKESENPDHSLVKKTESKIIRLKSLIKKKNSYLKGLQHCRLAARLDGRERNKAIFLEAHRQIESNKEKLIKKAKNIDRAYEQCAAENKALKKYIREHAPDLSDDMQAVVYRARDEIMGEETA